jgi:nicotinamidase-related amidase
MAQALLVVDLQHGLFAQTPAHDIDGVIGRINALAQRARSAGAPVFLIQHAAPGSPLAHGSPGWQLDARLETGADDIRIGKTTSAPYPSSDLEVQLRQRGVQEVVIAGYASEFCIDSTVRWSAALGFAVTLVADAHTTHDKAHLPAAAIVAHHNATLPAISSLGAPIRAATAASLW